METTVTLAINGTWGPQLSRSNSSSSLFDNYKDLSVTTDSMKTLLEVSQAEAESLATALRAIADKCPQHPDFNAMKPGEFVVASQLKSEYYRILFGRRTDLATIRQLLDKQKISEEVQEHCCVSLKLAVVQKVAVKKSKTVTTYKIRKSEQVCFKLYPYFVYEDKASSRTPRLIWQLLASGGTDFAPEGKNDGSVQSMIDAISSPYWALENICKHLEIPFKYSKDVATAIRRGDAGLHSVAFDCYTTPRENWQITEYFADIVARCNNTQVFTDPKKNRKVYLSTADCKNFEVEVKKTSGLFKSVVLRKSLRHDADRRENRLVLYMKRVPYVNEKGEQKGSTLVYRYVFNRDVLMSYMSRYMPDNFVNEKGIMKVLSTTFTVAQMARMRLNTENAVFKEPGHDAFFEAARDLITVVNEKEFALPQILGLSKERMQVAFMKFMDNPDKKGSLAKRRLFLTAYQEGKFHHKKGNDRYALKTEETLQTELGITRKSLRQYQQELFAFGVDVNLPFALLVKVAEQVRFDGWTIKETWLGTGNTKREQKLTQAFKRYEKLMKKGKLRKARDVLDTIKGSLDFGTTDSTMLGMPMVRNEVEGLAIRENAFLSLADLSEPTPKRKN